GRSSGERAPSGALRQDKAPVLAVIQTGEHTRRSARVEFTKYGGERQRLNDGYGDLARSRPSLPRILRLKDIGSGGSEILAASARYGRIDMPTPLRVWREGRDHRRR